MNTRPNVEINMDSDLQPGLAVCYLADGTAVRIVVPNQRPPIGTKSISLSVEDYGSILRASSASPYIG